MHLITEMVEDVKYLTEQKDDGSKSLFIEGIFLQSSIKNRNGRIYPEEVMDREVERYINEKVNAKRAFGELGHPDSPAINLDRISHIITELRKDGSNWIGKAKITNTPMGMIARGIMESGGQLGVSSRGVGTLKKVNGIHEVQDDFKIATAADIVVDPSAPDAFVNGIMEGVEWVWNPNRDAYDIAETAKNAIEDAVRTRQLQEQKLAIFEQYINRLANLPLL